MKLKLSIFLACILTVSVNTFGQKTESKTTETKTTEIKKVEVKTTEATAPTVVKLPTVKEILDKYVAAIGGRSATEKQKNRLTKGTIELAPMGVKGVMENYAAAPDKSYTKVNLGGIGEIIESFDGKNAWTINPIQGNRDKDGEELLQTKHSANFYAQINFDKIYSKLEVKGTEKIGEKETYVVVGTPEGLAPETFYFDIKSGLILRTDSTIVSPEGKLAAKTFFDDFREVDGIKTPFKSRVVMPQFEIITTLTEVKHGVTIEDSLFVKPKEQGK